MFRTITCCRLELYMDNLQIFQMFWSVNILVPLYAKRTVTMWH